MLAVVLVSYILVTLAVNYSEQTPPTAPPTSSSPPSPIETPTNTGEVHQKRLKHCTKIANARVLYQELKEIGSWEHLCLNLGVSSSTRNALKYENSKISVKKLRCVGAFFNKDTEPGVRVCWETVVSAVRNYPISNNRLADEIQENHVVDIVLVSP